MGASHYANGSSRGDGRRGGAPKEVAFSYRKMQVPDRAFLVYLAPVIGRFRASWLAVLLGVSSGLGGCVVSTLVVRQYAGPERPEEQTAILRVRGTDEARIIALDDQQLEAEVARDTRLHIEVLPGYHTVGVFNPRARLGRSRVLGFEAKGGKVYRVVTAPVPEQGPADLAPGGWVAVVFEVDAKTDEAVADVTRALPTEGSRPR